MDVVIYSYWEVIKITRDAVQTSMMLAIFVSLKTGLGPAPRILLLSCFMQNHVYFHHIELKLEQDRIISGLLSVDLVSRNKGRRGVDDDC